MSKTRIVAIAAACLSPVILLSACGGSPQGSSRSAADNGSGRAVSDEPPPKVFPCTGYPSLGTVTPPDLALPGTPASATAWAQPVKRGSVTGPTSYFGGPTGGADGAMSLTQQFPQKEMGKNPCNDTPGAGYHSYFAAMRFNPDPNRKKPDGSGENPNIYEYGKFYCPLESQFVRVPNTECVADTADGRYKQWDAGQGGMWGPVTWTLSYLYGRELLVKRHFTDPKTGVAIDKAVVVRAVDRGPDQDEEQWRQRPVDLSPWAMGALQTNPACIDWDGTNGLKDACDFTSAANDQLVTVCWAPNDMPLGPVANPTAAKCVYETAKANHAKKTPKK